jgi:hypothetical protein
VSQAPLAVDVDAHMCFCFRLRGCDFIRRYLAAMLILVFIALDPYSQEDRRTFAKW